MARTSPQLATAAASAARMIRREAMLKPGGKVLVAYSGGADSTALMLVMSALGYQVHLAHIDHSMRSSSGHDADHCLLTARSLGLPITLTKLNTAPLNEASAREARYGALQEIAQTESVRAIATGHTLDDQAETVELRVARGGFPYGMPPKRDNIIRPLLDLRRRSTAAICIEAGLPFVSDPSNLDARFSRNRVRARLAAADDSETMRLIRQAAQSREEVAAASHVAEEMLHEISFRHGALLFLRRDALLMADPALAQLVIRKALDQVQGDTHVDFPRKVLTKIVPVVSKGYDIKGPKLALWTEPAHLVIGPRQENRSPAPCDINPTGTTTCSAWNLRVVISDGASVSLEDPEKQVAESFSAEVVRAPLTLRGWKEADSFYPLGMDRRVKLSNFFIDSKIPARLRHRVPLLVRGETIVWIVGYRMSHRYRVREGPAVTVIVRHL